LVENKKKGKERIEFTDEIFGFFPSLFQPSNHPNSSSSTAPSSRSRFPLALPVCLAVGTCPDPLSSTCPSATPSPRDRVADSLSRTLKILLVGWFDLESLDLRRSLAQPTVCQRLYAILHALAYVRQPCTVRRLRVLLDKCSVQD